VAENFLHQVIGTLLQSCARKIMKIRLYL